MGPLLRLMAAKIARSRGEATLTDTLPNRASINIPRDGWPGFTLTTNLGTADENIDSGLLAVSRWPRWFVQAWPCLSDVVIFEGQSIHVWQVWYEI